MCKAIQTDDMSKTFFRLDKGDTNAIVSGTNGVTKVYFYEGHSETTYKGMREVLFSDGALAVNWLRNEGFK